MAANRPEAKASPAPMLRASVGYTSADIWYATMNP
eukprot:CAMPEP_0114653006 /NCGR_PEP_ID=MMETSP0191-20121206/9442_1 /TAXON_ID=126664 /ORGANISM="Sorites sp." /LENGTH=34 /DNA_ID= /DNA_START= /DNA_END= /DNA_ORIENTATION=